MNVFPLRKEAILCSISPQLTLLITIVSGPLWWEVPVVFMFLFPANQISNQLILG